MKETEFIEQNDMVNYLILTQAAFTLIRNIANNRNGKTDIDLSAALKKLQAIGKLSQALHNMPNTMNDISCFQREILQQGLYEFLLDYPQYLPTLCYRFRLPEHYQEEIKNSHSIVDNWQQILFPA